MTSRGWPVDPGVSAWELDRLLPEPEVDLVGIGGDLEPATLIAAYRIGLFPMGVGVGGSGPLGWWSPDPRGVIGAGDLIVRKSLRAARGRFDIHVNRDFAGTLDACGDPSRDGAWITDEIRQAYLTLHSLGWAHSVEAYQGDELVGGLYGVAIGGLFAGESMFHRVRDASKVALVALAELMYGDEVPGRLIEVQWATPHLARLGAQAIPRADYLRLLPPALAAPGPDWPPPKAG